MNPPQLNGYQVAVIIGLLIGLVLLSNYFNVYIDTEADKEPLGPNTGMYVVIGTTYTLIVAAVILGILFGLELAVWFAIVVFGTFMFAGLPMLFGAQQRGRIIRERFANGDRTQARNVAPTATPLEAMEWTDGDAR